MIGSGLCYRAGLESSGTFVRVGIVSSLLRIEKALKFTDGHKRQLAASLGMAALPSAIPQPLRNRTRLHVCCTFLKLVRKDSPMASLR